MLRRDPGGELKTRQDGRAEAVSDAGIDQGVFFRDQLGRCIARSYEEFTGVSVIEKAKRLRLGAVPHYEEGGERGRAGEG